LPIKYGVIYVKVREVFPAVRNLNRCLAVDLRQRAQAEEHGDDADRLRDKLVSLEEPDLVKLSSCLFRFKSIVAKMK